MTSGQTTALAAIAAAFEQEGRTDVAVVLGHGARLDVWSGRLRVQDGEGPFRRERTYGRVGGLRRLVVGAGTSGVVSLQVLRWCQGAGVSLVVLGRDESLLALGPMGTTDARILRLQAAPGPDLALAAVRQLLGSKLAGQAGVARDLLGDVAAGDTLESLGADLEVAPDLDVCRRLEAAGASLYWDAWARSVTLRFATREQVPSHWRSFDSRISPLAGNTNRRAADPANSVLNYLYRLAGAATRLALIAIGLSADLGFTHLDQSRGNSLTWDMLETIRPDVDQWLLRLVQQRTFRRADFLEAADGTVRIGLALRQELAATMAVWARAVAPRVETLHHLLGAAIEGKFTPVQPLSGARRKAAAQRVIARKKRASSQLSMWSCPSCGGEVAESHHVRCPACQARDPRQTPEIRGRRGRAIAGARAREQAWSAAGGAGALDPALWPEIQPKLASLPLSEIVAACQVAKSTASSWRAGHTQAHPGHWPALQALTSKPVGLAGRPAGSP